MPDIDPAQVLAGAQEEAKNANESLRSYILAENERLRDENKEISWCPTIVDKPLLGQKQKNRDVELNIAEFTQIAHLRFSSFFGEQNSAFYQKHRKTSPLFVNNRRSPGEISDLRVQNTRLEKDVQFFQVTKSCRETGALALMICGVFAPLFMFYWWSLVVYYVAVACAATSIFCGERLSRAFKKHSKSQDDLVDANQ